MKNNNELLKNTGAFVYKGITAPVRFTWLYIVCSRVPEVLTGSLVEWYERMQNIKEFVNNFVEKLFTQLCPSLL